MDYLPAQELVKSNTNLKILNEELFTDKYAVAVKKGNIELLNKINIVLQRLIDEGKIEEYTIKYSNDNFLNKTNILYKVGLTSDSTFNSKIQ